MGAKEEPYPSDVTQQEWLIVKPLLPKGGKLGRPPRYSQRVILNAILYVVRSGCTWRMMPKEFPHWRLVYYYFAKWQGQGVWSQLNEALRDRVRLKAGTCATRRWWARCCATSRATRAGAGWRCLATAAQACT